jgi:alcohol dehydrogenase class IV
VARILTGRADATPEDGVRWIAGLCRRLEIPPLGAYGVREEDIPALVRNAAQASSMKGNPVVLDVADLTEIATRAI